MLVQLDVLLSSCIYHLCSSVWYDPSVCLNPAICNACVRVCVHRLIWHLEGKQVCIGWAATAEVQTLWISESGKGARRERSSNVDSRGCTLRVFLSICYHRYLFSACSPPCLWLYICLTLKHCGSRLHPLSSDIRLSPRWSQIMGWNRQSNERSGNALIYPETHLRPSAQGQKLNGVIQPKNIILILKDRCDVSA